MYDYMSIITPSPCVSGPYYIFPSVFYTFIKKLKFTVNSPTPNDKMKIS